MKSTTLKFICALSLLLLAAPPALAFSPVRPAAAPAGEAQPRAYLPLVLDTRPAIAGTVTIAGVPAADVPLELLYDDGLPAIPNLISLQTTATAADGSFVFHDPPALPPTGVRPPNYMVRFQNDADLPDRVKLWQSYILAFDGQQTLNIGPLEIGDVFLTAPADNLTVTLPYTFTWLLRAASPSDNYTFHIFGTDIDSTVPDMGYVDSYYYSDQYLGPLEYNTPHTWEVSISNPTGYGISRLGCTVTFTTTTATTTSAASGLAPAPRLSLPPAPSP